MSVTTTEQKGRVSRRRMSGEDAIAVREILTLAMQTIEPEDRSQRQLFAALMPELYVLRMKGCGFGQLTALLNQSGFALQPSTVRTYYQDMLAEKMVQCEGRMDKQLVMLAKVEELTRGEDIAAIAAQVVETKEKQRAAVAARVAAVFLQPAPPVEKLAEAGAQRNEGPKARVKTTPPSAATAEAPSGPEEYGGFGLLAGGSSTVEVRPGAGFIEMDEDAPKVPILGAVPLPKTGENTSSPKLRCAKLQSGIEPLEQRAGVPPEVYKTGTLEHPAVPGLMLKKEERLYGALLEIIDENGELRMETLDEKRFRIKWKQPIPVGATASKKNFTEMDASLFAKRTKT